MKTLFWKFHALPAQKRLGLLLYAVCAARLGYDALAWWLGLPTGEEKNSALGIAVFSACVLLVATVLWFSPNIEDSASHALKQRYQREVLAPLGAYLLVMLAWNRLLDGLDIVWLRIVVALLPAACILLILRALARYVRDSDEMQRRIELESATIAACLVGAGYVTAGFLQSAQLIDVSASHAMLWVFPAICIVQGVIRIFIAKRYA